MKTSVVIMIVLLHGFLSLICIVGFADQASYRRLSLPNGTRGPESLVFDKNHGGPYTGISDGRVIRWDSKSQQWVDFSVPSKNRYDPKLKFNDDRPISFYSTPFPQQRFQRLQRLPINKQFSNRPQNCNGSQDPFREDICGRPLGLEFNPADGFLYIADSAYGLLKVGPRGGVATLLANTAGGVNLTFTNSLVINQDDGLIYFTDSSTRFKRRDNLQVVTTGDNTGRLLRYDPRKNTVEILMTGLKFPNGLALSKDNRFLLMAETTTGKITRYWLKGAKACKHEEFARVPRHPDNIRRNSRGEFWIAIEQSPSRVGDVSNKYSIFQKPDPNSIVKGVLLDEEGAIVSVLGADGGRLTSLSEIDEKEDTLWIGSVQLPYVGIYEA